jgi:hypothetical protein
MQGRTTEAATRARERALAAQTSVALELEQLHLRRAVLRHRGTPDPRDGIRAADEPWTEKGRGSVRRAAIRVADERSRGIWPHLAEIRTPLPMECRGDEGDGGESRRC